MGVLMKQAEKIISYREIKGLMQHRRRFRTIAAVLFWLAVRLGFITIAVEREVR